MELEELEFDDKEVNTENNAPVKKGQFFRGTVVVILGLVLIAVGVGKFFSSISDYKKSEELYSTTNEKYVEVVKEENETVTEDEEDCWKSSVYVNFEELKMLNPEIIGWIYFENEDISYPILFSGDNYKYLRTGYNGERFSAGSIYIDGENETDFSDDHTIIYGHAMKNDTMFGKLKYYRRDGYFDEHKYFQILTPDCQYRFAIVSYKDVDEDSDIYTLFGAGNEGFAGFVKDKLLKGSYINTGYEYSTGDRLVTLSTCSSDTRRLVISAVMVEQYIIN